MPGAALPAHTLARIIVPLLLLLLPTQAAMLPVEADTSTRVLIKLLAGVTAGRPVGADAATGVFIKHHVRATEVIKLTLSHIWFCRAGVGSRDLVHADTSAVMGVPMVPAWARLVPHNATGWGDVEGPPDDGV